MTTLHHSPDETAHAIFVRPYPSAGYDLHELSAARAADTESGGVGGWGR